MSNFTVEENKSIYGAKIKVVGVGGGGGELQKCSFGRGSQMIRARSRMIRARPDDPG